MANTGITDEKMMDNLMQLAVNGLYGDNTMDEILLLQVFELTTQRDTESATELKTDLNFVRMRKTPLGRLLLQLTRSTQNRLTRSVLCDSHLVYWIHRTGDVHV